jgi:hypothetical protein
MTAPAIIRKLEAELSKGITTESQVVYLLAEVRKLLEQQNAKQEYEYLTFHCDWVLHPRLAGRTAQRILKQFDDANVHLKAGIHLHDLPPELRSEIDGISKMRFFKKELYRFLEANGLPNLDTDHPDGWAYFLRLYGKVVEDCPLVMAEAATSSIVSVTVSVEEIPEPVENQRLFGVKWTVLDKNGHFGDIFIINGYEQKPDK